MWPREPYLPGDFSSPHEDLRCGFGALHSLHYLGIGLIETPGWWKVQVTTGVNQREGGAHQPVKGPFYLFPFTAQIPRTLMFLISLRQQTFPCHVSSSSFSYNCFFTDHVCAKRCVYELHFILYHLMKGVFS